MRNFGVTLVSLVLTSAVVGNAYFQKKQFYPSVVYITKSNPSMAVIYIQAFILVILAGKLMRKVFFGELRPAEFEHLMERSWYAMTETCLAFTVFRDDFSPKFVALFTILLFLKSFHWLAEDRVDYMERSPVISWLFHIRVLSLLTLLGALDLHLVGHAYQSTITKGASVQLVFGFEYAILLTIIINIAIKYILHTIDINSENPWENKVVFLLYTELIMGFFKVVLYILFLAIMIRLSMLPLFAFRPMYYTMRAFKKAFNDVILSRRAIRNMNTLYPDATPEELAASNVCIICREEMTTASKKLPCNHIFHTSCLRSWFQRQQTCPTCRLNILRTTPTTQPPRGPAARPQAAHANAPDQRPPPAFQPPPFPFVWAPQQPQQPQQPAGGEQNNAGTTTSSGEVPPPMPNNMPFFCPPFPFMPFGVPPPMPPADFTGLSEEELHRMEEAGRTGVEARLRCLRNIQLLLDTSVIMMQQYVASAATAISNSSTNTAMSSASDVTPSTSTAVSPDCTATPTTSSVLYSESTPTPSPSKFVSSADTASPSTEESTDSTAPFPTNSSSESMTFQKTDNDKHSTQTPDPQIPTTSFINSELNTVETASSSESTPKTSTSPELEEARRRRLQKFM